MVLHAACIAARIFLGIIGSRFYGGWSYNKKNF